MDTYQPSDAKIAEIMARFTPRQMAIAYLRQKHKTAQAELAFQVMGSVTDLSISALSGDLDGAKKAVADAGRYMRTHKEVTE